MRAASAWLAGCAVALCAAPPVREARAAGGAPLAMHAEAAPDHAPIGALLHYRGWIVLPRGERVSWIAPRTDATLSWGAPATTRVSAAGGTDTARVDADLQLFALGRIDVPGVRFSLEGAGAPRALPVVHLEVQPQIGADSNASFRPVRGPLAAPWWERVPWRLVLAGLGAVLVIVGWFVASRRAPAPARASRGAPSDPASEALAELAALRRLRLPEAGRYDEHAFRLTLLLRRFLERTAGGIAPGLTSRELVAWLEGHPTRIDVARLDALMRVWDILKFARAPGSADQSHDSERAVESWLRASVRVPLREVA